MKGSALLSKGWIVIWFAIVAFCVTSTLGQQWFFEQDQTPEPLAIIEAKKPSKEIKSENIKPIVQEPTNGVPPSVAFASLPQGTDKDKRISVLITDVGVNPDFFEMALAKLPPQVSFAIRADAPDLQAKIDKARAAGHEVFLMIPMEPEGYPYNDPGRLPLLASLSTDENITRIKEHLGKVSGVIGVVPFMGQAFTRNPEASEPVAKWLANAGYLLLDTTSIKRRSSMADAFADAGGKYVAYPSPMEECLADEQLKTIKLDYIETVADREGFSMGVITCVPKAIDLVATWTAGLAKKKLLLTPVSSTVLEKEIVSFNNKSKDDDMKQAEVDDNNHAN